MGRLKAIKPRLAMVRRPLGRSPRGETQAERTRRRDADTPWRRWYKTARWQRLRWKVLAEAMFVCARCGRLEGETSQLVADHKVPHRGDPALFWDETNLQCLCKPCHDRAKQAEERAGLHG